MAHTRTKRYRYLISTFGGKPLVEIDEFSNEKALDFAKEEAKSLGERKQKIMRITRVKGYYYPIQNKLEMI